ncbi:MAG TPA: YkgJ family cysteine cluster protein [Kofleriaceae bacterium]|nr:YkgJ family cysteine cluster protein [Kofleriaceae bacterium]
MPDDKPALPDDKRALPDDKPSFGTAEPNEPITRADFERAVRFLNLSDLEIRDTLLRLAAQVVALTDELVRRIDKVEPEPAAPNTPAREVTNTVECAVVDAVPVTLAKIRAAEVRDTGRVWIEIDQENKYDVTSPDIPCAELLHLCQARCCRMGFPLSTADLDEGVIRWDYGQPYMIRQRASDGFCVHNDPDTHGCTVHAHRPLVCRKYDCREDVRVWIDYEKRIPAPNGVGDREQKDFDLMERVRKRHEAMIVENAALVQVFPDKEPHTGPALPQDLRLFHKRPPGA